MGIPVKNLSAAEIQQAQQQAQAIASAATLAVKPGQFIFFAAFDGTNNNRNNLALTETKQR